MKSWKGLVNVIIYSVLFDELDDTTRDRVVGTLLTEPVGTATPEEEHEILAEGIRGDYPIPTVIETRHKPEEIRKFLESVVAGMDAARPWPTLPYTLLPVGNLPDFLASWRHVARIRQPFSDIEPAVRRNFRYDEEHGRFLLFRMRSGVDIGLFPDYWENSTDTLLAAAGAPIAAHDIVAELVAGSELAAPDFALVAWPVPPADGYPRYETTPLRPEFHGEHLPGNKQWADTYVHYLSAENRFPYRLLANNGLLYTMAQQPLDTTHTRTLWTPQGGRAIFVMDSDGTLYASPEHVLGRFHHSSLLAGGPVAGAGEIAAVAGQVTLISDHSTHYGPARRFTRQVIDSLARQGLATERVRVEYHSPPD